MHYTILLAVLLQILPSAKTFGEENVAPSRVAILGESFTSDNELSGINEEVLSRLFSLIRKSSPAAIIFTGNMTLGLQKDSKPPLNSVEIFTTKKPTPIDYLDAVDTSQWPREGYSYDSAAFQKAIARFLAIKDQALGKNIPFYPVIAAHEAYGADSVAVVQAAFNIPTQVPPFVSSLAYTFTVNKALFVVFSTAQFSETRVNSGTLSPLLLKWLDDILKEQRSHYDFLFVVGNEPAFSTTSATSNSEGIEGKILQRDLFWRILVNHRVTAYFCSEEHLYDRTNRGGVWQIISGGAGTPFYQRDFDKAFYHFLLLTIPVKEKELPKIQVFDVQGNLEDEFDLIPSQYPVYQLRIS